MKGWGWGGGGQCVALIVLIVAIFPSRSMLFTKMSETYSDERCAAEISSFKDSDF